jgi:putative protease
MTDMDKKIELVMPAGNLERLKVAVRYGADAVYLSDRFFGLRGKAGNFTLREMKEGVEYAHSKGCKAYCTVNVFAYNKDFRRVEQHLKILKHDIGVDAVIISDPGLVDLAREVVPELPVHLSTQANTLNYRACMFWKKQGVKRVVLARELPFEDIKEIAEKDIMELEVFVHGSLCIAYSGRCFLSNYMTRHRDANRGLCTNSCRWSYAVMEEQRDGEFYPMEQDERGTLFFNSKDLCLIQHIPSLVGCGVQSLKVEGRTKSVSYCSTVAAVYRQAIDAYYESEERFREELPRYHEELSLLGGRGYTEGLFVKKAKDQYNYDGKDIGQYFDYAGLLIEKVSQRDKQLYKVNIKKKVLWGDKVQLFLPGLCKEQREISGIYNLEGYPVQSAVPGDTVLLDGFSDCEEYTVLRLEK